MSPKPALRPRQPSDPGGSAAPQELEAKFAVTDLALWAALEEAPTLTPTAALGPSHIVSHTDQYVDTPEFALLRAGWSLRLRHSPHGTLITLKGLPNQADHHLHLRSELEGPVSDLHPATDPAAWPKPVAKRVRRLAGRRPQLIPLCVLQQERTKRPVTLHIEAIPGSDRPTAVPVGELSLDRVTLYGDAGPLPTCAAAPLPAELRPLAQFWELEIELAAGQDPSQLQALVLALQGQPGLEPMETSKFERALLWVSDRAPDSPPGVRGIQPTMEMAEACRTAWRYQLMQMLLHEAGVRADQDIEAVHQMRVATRRARAAYVVFGSALKLGTVRPHLRGLRRTARLLGAVRDLDVAGQQLRSYCKGQPPEVRRQGKVLQAHLAAERKAAYTELRAWLDSQEYAYFVADFARFCATPGRGARLQRAEPDQPVVPSQVRHLLPAAVQARFGALRAFETLFEGAQPIPYETLHALRIHFKILRYTLEFVAPLLQAEGAALIEQSKSIQELLGELNDAAVEQVRLEKLANQLPDMPLLQRYVAAQEEIMARAAAAFPAVWEQFNHPTNRRLLALAVAHL